MCVMKEIFAYLADRNEWEDLCIASKAVICEMLTAEALVKPQHLNPFMPVAPKTT